MIVATQARSPRRPGRRAALAVLGGLLLGGLVACQVRLVAEYDEHIDAEASRLQKEMDSYLTGLESGLATEGAVAPYTAEDADWYDRYAVDVRSVRVRARAHPKNRISVEQYSLLLDSLEVLEQTHAGELLARVMIPIQRDLFNQAWGSIIELEVAKRR